MRQRELSDTECAIAQALGVVGDWWTLLIVRDIAGGVTRFDALHKALGVSRKVLTERLAMLVDHDVLAKRRYSDHPPRFDYTLTAKGQGLLPVLITLQDWGNRHLLGDGSLTATSAASSAEARRAHALVGHRVPAMTLTDRHDDGRDAIAADRWTVLFCFPGAYAPNVGGYPPGWGEIPGAPGCTLETAAFRDKTAEFDAAGADIHGVSTQRPDELKAFAEHAALPFLTMSDTDGQLTAALRLPTFRAAGVDRLKRLTIVVDPERTVRGVLYPITDPAGSVDDALTLVRKHAA